MELAGKRIIVLAEDLYNERELWVPYYRMQEAGADVLLVGPEADRTYKSKIGMPVRTDAASADLNGADFDAIIIPGGYAPDRMRRHASMIKLVRDAFDAGRLIAFICHAGWLAISADIVRGKRATCYVSIKDDLVNAGAEYVDAPVVRDGNMITSRQPDDLPQFCRAIVTALQE